MKLTSLETRHWSGYLYSASQKIGKGRKSEEEEKSDGCRRAIEQGFSPIDDHSGTAITTAVSPKT